MRNVSHLTFAKVISILKQNFLKMYILENHILLSAAGLAMKLLRKQKQLFPMLKAIYPRLDLDVIDFFVDQNYTAETQEFLCLGPGLGRGCRHYAIVVCVNNRNKRSIQSE